MRIRPKYSHWLPKLLKVDGITLYPWILFAPAKEDTRKSLHKHEMIHVEQIRQTGWLRFYLTYIGQFLWRLLIYRSRDKAYRSLSYEVEAYSKQSRPLTQAQKAELNL